MENLLGINRLDQQLWRKWIMQHYSIFCQFNFEVDPVIIMYIKRNIYHRDLKGSVKESRARLVFCVLGLCRFGPKERTCGTCVVYRVNEGST